MLLLADNDIGGAVAGLRRLMESAEWAAFTTLLDSTFKESD
jgi:hypothetical protein